MPNLIGSLTSVFAADEPERGHCLWRRTTFSDFSDKCFPFDHRYLLQHYSTRPLLPGPFESTVKASNQAWAKIEIWECDTADPAGNVLSSLSIPVHMHPWPLFAGTTGLKLICACISLRASLPRLQDCFAWLQTFNRSGAAAQPVCDVRAKQMVFFPSSSAWTLDLLVTCWRQNCCLPEPLRNAWRDHVYLLFGGALTPQQGALTELVARVKRNVGQTEPFNGRSG